MTAEMGKPLREARGEAARAATILRFAAGECWRSAGEVYEPSVTDQHLYTLPVAAAHKIGRLSPQLMPRVDKALKAALEL